MACNLIPIKSSANDDYTDNEELNYQQKYSRTPKQFDTERRQALSRLDLSKKGSIDESIESLVINLNKSSNFYTTSSCSGRIIVVTKPSDNIESINEKKKKGLQWQFVTHSLINDVEEFVQKIVDHSQNMSCNETSTLKFESFILHLRCRTLDAARQLLHCSIDSGQRNSGLMIANSGHLTVAVRNTLNLEVPIIIDGKLMVTLNYLRKLVDIVNAKMVLNFEMIQRFERNCELKSIFY
ncbi:tRNA wybutosine-synthesizing protein 3 homolog [Dermatophagoides farinae]|uniref:tRNA wybutosine-synthesizing protein 3 homolog n=1 Tax=Dermatophagoides farinae TaxID=6954 RepID=A0A9D4SHQ8_DERFA|nr:tRNA wybutosine-synthesizing protein 3 homolog [Dermatophagoides farinae]KAH7642006.1 trna wybutosine-synthesizing protein 3-like protein [Dermatophagoides farinae]